MDQPWARSERPRSDYARGYRDTLNVYGRLNGVGAATAGLLAVVSRGNVRELAIGAVMAGILNTGFGHASKDFDRDPNFLGVNNVLVLDTKDSRSAYSRGRTAAHEAGIVFTGVCVLSDVYLVAAVPQLRISAVAAFTVAAANLKSHFRKFLSTADAATDLS